MTRTQFVVDTRTREAEARMKSTRILGLKAAKFLASKVKGQSPDSTKTYELGPVDPDLPKVVFLPKNLSASFYGSFTTSRKWVVPMHPNELMDGAAVNFGFLIGAHFRDATYTYQRNAVIEELYSRHGIDLNFRGVLFCSEFPYTLEEKELEAGSVVRTAKMLGADAAILGPLSDGHPSVETMLICRLCEEAGIRTAIGAGEMTAAEGDPGFTHLVPEADALVIGGDSHHKLSLPAVERVLGGVTGPARRPGPQGRNRGRGAADVRRKQPSGAHPPYGKAALAARLQG